MAKVIGLVGKLQSGKTTTANFILDKVGDKAGIKTSFGNLLKEMILRAKLCNEEELWGKKTDFSRLMLQKIGTDIIRKQVDENFWVKEMKCEIEQFIRYNPEDITIIIDDVRFLNEANLVKEYNGTLIKIFRPSLSRNEEKDQHASEIEQDKIIPDYTIINNGSTEDLKTRIDKILQEI